MSLCIPQDFQAWTIYSKCDPLMIIFFLIFFCINALKSCYDKVRFIKKEYLHNNIVTFILLSV